jgi:hypothetical protein
LNIFCHYAVLHATRWLQGMWPIDFTVTTLFRFLSSSYQWLSIFWCSGHTDILMFAAH